MLFNATGAYVLVLGLASVFVLVLLLHKQRSGKEIKLWLFSGLVGILLGAAGAIAVTTYLGYELSRRLIVREQPSGGAPGGAPMGGMGGGPGMMGGMGGGPGMMGGMGGGPGMMGGMGGGPPSIPPKRQLTTLVRKLELLTGDIALTLSDDQAAAICGMLAEVEAADTMTDEEAQEKYDALLGVLNEDQTAKQEKIRLARSPAGGGGGMPGMMGGPPPEDENANPFKEAPNAEAAAALSQRFGGKEDPPAEDVPKEKAEP